MGAIGRGRVDELVEPAVCQGRAERLPCQLGAES